MVESVGGGSWLQGLSNKESFAGELDTVTLFSFSFLQLVVVEPQRLKKLKGKVPF